MNLENSAKLLAALFFGGSILISLYGCNSPFKRFENFRLLSREEYSSEIKSRNYCAVDSIFCTLLNVRNVPSTIPGTCCLVDDFVIGSILQNCIHFRF